MESLLFFLLVALFGYKLIAILHAKHVMVMATEDVLSLVPHCYTNLACVARKIERSHIATIRRAVNAWSMKMRRDVYNLHWGMDCGIPYATAHLILLDLIEKGCVEYTNEVWTKDRLKTELERNQVLYPQYALSLFRAFLEGEEGELSVQCIRVREVQPQEPQDPHGYT